MQRAASDVDSSAPPISSATKISAHLSDREVTPSVVNAAINRVRRRRR